MSQEEKLDESTILPQDSVNIKNMMESEKLNSCVAEGTLIATNIGLIPIEKISKEKLSQTWTDNNHTLDLVNVTIGVDTGITYHPNGFTDEIYDVGPKTQYNKIRNDITLGELIEVVSFLLDNLDKNITIPNNISRYLK
jgi:hypothetical protein